MGFAEAILGKAHIVVLFGVFSPCYHESVGRRSSESPKSLESICSLRGLEGAGELESTRSGIWGKPQKRQKRQKRQRRVRFASLFSFFFLLLKRLAGVYFVDVAIEQPQNPQQKTPRDQKMDKEVRDMEKHHLTNRSDQGMAYERTGDER